MKRFFMLCVFSVFLLSCAHVISSKYADVAVKNIPFAQFIKNTDAYVNELFIYGGIIADTKITAKGTEIEVVQTPLDKFGNIVDRDVSEGRFIISTPRFLDPLIYRKGRDIIIAGVLSGSQKKSLGEIEYVYPVFEIKEIYLYKEDIYYPYQYPFYRDGYPYWYDPFYTMPGYYPYDPSWYRQYDPLMYRPYGLFGPFINRPYLYPYEPLWFRPYAP